LVPAALAAMMATAQIGTAHAQDADEAINICKEAAAPGLNSTVTADLVRASIAYIDCLKVQITMQAQALFDEEQRAAFEAELDNLIASSTGAYATLYNRNIYCVPACGQMYRYVRYSKPMALLEELLRDVVWTKEQYEAVP
jgi:hypothetical protein